MKLVRFELVVVAGISLAVTARAQVTQLVSVGTGGVPANGLSMLPSVSDDGRFVAFCSQATNLVGGDTNGQLDVFLRDRTAGTTERISVDSSEVQGNGESYSAWRAITPDHRYVVFQGTATNLVPGDTNGVWDVFVRDRQAGTTERVSVSSAGVEGNALSEIPVISADGRYVAFHSHATNLHTGDANAASDIFVRDRQTGMTELVSVDSSEVQGNFYSAYCAISASGRYVAFRSESSNLVPGDTNFASDIFVRDRQAGTTERVSLTPLGGEFGGCGLFLDISADGRYVAFSSPEFAAGESIYVRDRSMATTTLLVDGGSSWAMGAQFAGDGLFIAFVSAEPLFPPDTNLVPDVFVWDAQASTGARESVSSAGAQGNGQSGLYAVGLTPDRRYLTFDSAASNLVAGDTNGVDDIFIRDRVATNFTSLCHAGTGGVQNCPCGNPPSSVGRGCNNSASTGGARLLASGAAYLSEDTLVFTTIGERATATSVVWQGPSTSAAGIIFGQGLRCVTGVLKRLYIKNAVGGSITAPNFSAGDPTVSAQSAAKGAPISAGQMRYYMVSYRDPVVLGGCPSTSTFNVTQTGRVVWSP